ncbi:MAG: flagellar export chaperone FlgN [Spirochaetales bacterium]|jgi:hypothetical protein|nr:flagellar export chaperone FlgN [Spirochaetales bacterium]
MSIVSHDLRLLEHLMREEAETLESLCTLEEKLRHSALSRDWQGLDKTLQEVKLMSEKVAQTEQIRAVVYQKLRISCKSASGESFQELLARVPREEQGNLAALHSRVRCAVEKVKCLTGGLETYIHSTVSTMDKILEEIFPDRRNKIYTRTGETVGSSRPMMISRSF